MQGILVLTDLLEVLVIPSRHIQLAQRALRTLLGSAQQHKRVRHPARQAQVADLPEGHVGLYLATPHGPTAAQARAGSRVFRTTIP